MEENLPIHPFNNHTGRLQPLDDAITRAHQLFELNPNREDLAYSIGWLYKKLGRYPTAAHHYDIQLSHQPDHHHAAKSSSLMHLLCGEIEIANESWAGYESILAKLLLGSEGVQIGGGEVVDTSSYLQKEQANWQALLDRALSVSSAETRLADLVDLMEKRFGVDAGFPPRPLSTLEIYRSLQVPDSVGAREARFNLQLQAVGDSSILIAQIKHELPGWGNLPPSAQYSMIEAQKRISSQEIARDFSPYVVALASAVEKTMKILVFEAFRSNLASDLMSREQFERASPEDQEKLKRFTAFLYKGSFLELGGMENVLKLLTGRTARRILILQRLNKFLIDGGFGALTTQTVLEALTAMTKSRNSAAHSDSLTREDALRVKGEVLTVLDALVHSPS